MMQKKRYKNAKKIGIIFGLIILVIILIRILIPILTFQQDSESIMPSNISSIEDLLKYYDCKDIKVVTSTDEPFRKDIYVTFGRDLLTEERTNQDYYNSIILNITELMNNQSYRFIDSSRELVVAVIIDEKSKKIENIYINGELNYFEKEKSKIQATKFEKEKITEMTIQADEINKFITNNWVAGSVNLGSVESRCDEYDIYFDEGLELKTLGGKVYNLIFTLNYKSEIINNLGVNSSQTDIIEKMGEPTFRYESMIGYKGEECYVFFLNDHVSVYPRAKDYQTDEFLLLLNNFQENKDAKQFVTELSSLWKDYNKFDYDVDYIELEYAIKGICVQFDVGEENGIILYNNYEGHVGKDLTLENLTYDNLPNQVYLHTNEDLVNLREIDRMTIRESYYLEEYITMKDENDYKEEAAGISYRFTENISEKYELIYQYETGKGIRDVKFISKNQTEPNSELIRHKQIYTYGWLNDDEFLYSVKGEGIFCYNASTRKLTAIITGTEEYKINKVIENIIFYDETTLEMK